MTDKNNMALWELVQTSDPDFIKPIPGGANLSAIDAHYQIKNATRIWGAYVRRGVCAI